MKRLMIKRSSILVLILMFLYLGYFFIRPSVTIINNSGQPFIISMVKLPSSHLDFGVIGHNSQNTIYYSLEQKEGVYHYFFNIGNTANVQGECGLLSNNEIHKRLVIEVGPLQQVTCSS